MVRATTTPPRSRRPSTKARTVSEGWKSLHPSIRELVRQQAHGDFSRVEVLRRDPAGVVTETIVR